MSSFKSGAGDLDFGENESSEEGQGTDESENDTSTSDQSSNQSSIRKEHRSESKADTTPKYPYFVRRNNVGDERDQRLEIHVRDKVASEEAAFRAELADHLGVDEISKTDAREFALLAAFENPESVATRMQEEGFGELD